MLINLERREPKSVYWRRPVPWGVALLLILGAGSAFAYWFRGYSKDQVRDLPSPPSISYRSVRPPEAEPEQPEEAWQFVPGPISMDEVKKKGCVADGFLNDYGDDRKEMVKLINRSECVYLHRALETWLHAPDFDEAREVMQRVEKKPIIYGMFLAEAIGTEEDYDDPLSGDDYEYKKMCREGTEGKWGKDTCVPSIQSVEYRRYLKAITRRAMDLGIQSFLFGQVVLQDEHPDYRTSEMQKVISEMRKYAKSKNMQIIIGGQTDSITDEKYLRMFDYIEGGLGLGEDGRFEEGPCWSRMSNCWALLWNDRFAKKANHVLLHLDWTGIVWDDMSVFSRMEHEQRMERLSFFYRYFTSRNFGFMMPYLAVVNRNDGGCHGPTKEFYSPSPKYGCKDEDDIVSIMRKQ